MRAAALVHGMGPVVGSVHFRQVYFFEQCLQFRPSPVDAAFDRTHRKTRDLGYLLIGQLLHVSQDHHLPEFFRNLSQRLLDEEILDRGLGVFVRAERLIGDLYFVLFIIPVNGLQRIETYSDRARLPAIVYSHVENLAIRR
jgi:hypothetical protein